MICGSFHFFQSIQQTDDRRIRSDLQVLLPISFLTIVIQDLRRRIQMIVEWRPGRIEECPDRLFPVAGLIDQHLALDIIEGNPMIQRLRDAVAETGMIAADTDQLFHMTDHFSIVVAAVIIQRVDVIP